MWTQAADRHDIPVDAQDGHRRQARLRSLLHALMLAATAACTAAEGWQSQLLTGSDRHGWTPHAVDLGGRSWSLPDFSYAGYRQGTVALGNAVACRVMRLDGEDGEDISAALTAGIRELARNGGGILRLPAGQFRLSRSIGIDASNIAIEGAGSQRTHLTVAARYQPRDPWDEGVFSFGRNAPDGWRQGWWSQAPEVTRLAEAVEAGDEIIRVTSGRSLRPGQWVALTQALWPAASRRWSGGDWPAFDPDQRPTGHDRLFTLVYLRMVTDVDGDRIQLDAPLPWPMDPANNPIRLVAPDQGQARMLEDVGLSGLSVSFEAADGPERPRGSAVVFEGVRNGWLHDVSIHNIRRTGVRITHSARVTVRNTLIRGMQDGGGGGWGYGFDVFAAQDILLHETVTEWLRHGVTLSRLPTSNVVVSGHRSIGSTMDGDDSHHSPVQQVLFDRHEGVRGAGLRMAYRGDKSNGAHETLASGVVWNARGDDSPGRWYGHGVVVDPLDVGWALVVGVAPQRRVFQDGRPLGRPPMRRVPETKDPLRLPALPGRNPGHASGNVYYEGIGRPGLQPQSLYTAPLQTRTGRPVARYRDDCGQGVAPSPAVERTEPPPRTRLYDNGSGSAVVRLNNAHAGVQEQPTDQPNTPRAAWIRIEDRADAWTPLVTLRHPRHASGRVDSVRLLLRTSRPARFRLQLAEPSLPHETRMVGKTATFDVAAKQWTSVSVPLPKLDHGAVFDTLVLKASGQKTGAVVEIRRIELE